MSIISPIYKKIVSAHSAMEIIMLNFNIVLIISSVVLFAMSIGLGGFLKFYDKYPWWDRLLHFVSAGLFVSYGVALTRGMVELNKFSVLVFGFTLSMTLHVLWEMGEYVLDTATHSNHQRWQKHHPAHNHNPKGAIQPAGLVDTMNDTAFCIAGTILACAIWWLFL